MRLIPFLMQLVEVGESKSVVYCSIPDLFEEHKQKVKYVKYMYTKSKGKALKKLKMLTIILVSSLIK